MEGRMNTEYVRDVLLRQDSYLESGEQIIIWLEKALNEIESLRSQLAEAWSPEEFAKKEEHWAGLIRYANGQVEKAKHDLKQAEQERDKYKAYVNTVNHDSEQAAIKATYQSIELADMREALEWYGNSENHVWWINRKGEVDQSPVMKDEGKRSRNALSRYPKEG